jgi:hypothetical protein
LSEESLLEKSELEKNALRAALGAASEFMTCFGFEIKKILAPLGHL